jgi:hypothetical protein
MPDYYQVFCDNLSGMTHCPALGGETLQECFDSIQNGSQHWLYHIYVFHDGSVPYWGKRPDVYRFLRTVAGSQCKIQNSRCLDYALTTWEDNWLFTDKMFH